MRKDKTALEQELDRRIDMVLHSRRTKIAKTTKDLKKAWLKEANNLAERLSQAGLSDSLESQTRKEKTVPGLQKPTGPKFTGLLHAPSGLLQQTATRNQADTQGTRDVY